MDFFEQQHVAHKKTGRLVAMFVLAVAGIVVAVYLVLGVVFFLTMAGQSAQPPTFAQVMGDPRLVFGVPAVVLAIVGVAMLVKMTELRAGGRVIAEQLGGRLLDASAADPTERKVLNVVEEMAIASGVPVPPVYLLDNEQGINAFAAGYSPSDAVIGVTRGCVELLDRDELQGVIAHEFSHILNGDMRLNIRLIGVLFGILVIGMIGSILLRSMFYAGAAGGRSRRRGDSGGAQAMLVILGVGISLIVIGSLGVLFGNLIKAAVSRQREFLADASAVQFTRQPDGIAGALKKIGGVVSGGKLAHPKAEEASHMYFAEGVGHWLGGMMATHPPLPQRIKRIDPSWDGRFPRVEPTAKVQQRLQKLSRTPQRPAPAAAAAATAMAAPLVMQIGRPDSRHVTRARQLLESLDESIASAAREPYGARAVVYALLLDKDQTIRGAQVAALRRDADPRVAELTLKLADAVGRMDPAARLPLLDLALPALRKLSETQHRIFHGNVDALIEADQRVDVFEWVLRRVVVRHLEAQFGTVRRPVVQFYNLRGRAVRDACSVLLSVLAYVGHREPDPALRAFGAGAAAMGLGDLQPLSPDQSTLGHLGEALGRLNEVAPRSKRPIIVGAAACIASDRQATVQEVELLRAICDTLDAPMPPLLPGQSLT